MFSVIHFEGKTPGPRVLITAGVHGDEWLPMRVVRELARWLAEDEALRGALRGRLTLIPVVHEAAFRRGHRCGPEGKDLARTCPGRAEGGETERVAHALSAQIQAADFYLDLHTGGRDLCVTPLAGYGLHRDAEVLAVQRRMARAFQLPLVWGTSAELEGRSLSVARDARVPAIYVEYLGGVAEQQEIARGMTRDHPCVQGCLNVLRELGALAGEVSGAVEPQVIEDARPESGHMQVCHPSPVTGFLRPLVELNRWVEAGEPLAEVEPLEGGPSAVVTADQAGLVVVRREVPQINAGDAVAVVAQSFPAA